MNIAAELGFAFDINKLAITNVHDAADARRFTECARMAGEFNHRQGVDLPDAFAFGFNQDLFLQDFILHSFCEVAFTPLPACQHRLHFFASNLLAFAEGGGLPQLAGYP